MGQRWPAKVWPRITEIADETIPPQRAGGGGGRWSPRFVGERYQ
jgi:hypothetical protein